MKQWAQTIIWITIIFSLCVQSYSAQDPTSSIDNEHPIIFHKIAFTDDDSFDLFLEGILQSGYDNILILTELEYDGIKPPVIPPRLKAWIESYIEANKGKSWGFRQPNNAVTLARKKSGEFSIRIVPDIGENIKILMEIIIDQIKVMVRYITNYVYTGKRKDLLSGYYLAVVSSEGKAAFILSKESLDKLIETHRSK